MISVTVDSTYTEKDGRISVHFKLTDSGGKVLDGGSVQVKSVDELKDALRAKVTEATEKEEQRLSIKESAQLAVDELTVEIAAAKEATKNGTELDR